MKWSNKSVLGAVSVGVALAIFILSPIAARGLESQERAPGTRWVTAWATSQQSLGRTGITNATVRMIVQAGVPGEAVRVRIDNAFGKTPLTIGRAQVALRRRGATLVAGSSRPLSFGGSASVAIPPGGSAVSDSVPLAVIARQDLAVSLHVPGADVLPSQHSLALTTSYLTANGAGDATADELPDRFTNTTTSMFWVKAVDVLAAASASAVVTFGDSITDGTCATVDGDDTWGDWLAIRLDLSGRRQIAVLNEAIAGNTMTRFPADQITSPPGVDRLDGDVLSHSGVTHVVVFMGTNDLRRGLSAADLIAGTEDIIRRVKARGLRVYGVTVIPRHVRPPQGGAPGWSVEASKMRREVNEWIRTKAPFDAIIDFDEVVRDPGNSDLIRAAFNCDDIHLNSRGYYEVAKSIRLDLFEGTSPAATAASASATQPAAQPASAAYNTVCMTCHGPQGRGGIGPRLVPMTRTGDEVLAIVREGTGQMPPVSMRELSDAQVLEAVEYLRSLGR